MSDPKAESTSNTITVPVDELIKARDGVVTGLTTLTSAINELIRAYIQNTNEILRDAGVPSSSIAPHALFEVSMNSLFGSGGPDIKLGKKGTLVIGGKPKKERKARDPNAPKRPLTAFFLYSASARPIVKQDLPETATSQEVSNEVLRRWNEMPISEKEGWKKTYEENATKYREEVAAYKARVGAVVPADESDAEGAGAVAVPAVILAAAVAAAAADDDSDEDSDDETPIKPVVSAPPPKAKAPTKAAAAAKKKAAAAAAAAASAPAPASPSPSAQLHFGGAPTKQTPVPLPGASEGAATKKGEKRKKDADDDDAKKAKKPKKDKKEDDKKEKKEKEKKEKKEKKDKKKPKDASS